MKFLKTHNYKSGFTIVEMLVVAPIVILAIGAFLTAIISMTGEVIASRASNALAYNVQDALNRIEQDVKLSSAFLAKNNVLFQGSNTNQGYNDDTTNFTNVAGASETSKTSIILNMTATTKNPFSISSSYVFLKDAPNPCTTAQSNTLFTYNVVYFIKDDTLWRRTLMPENYADTVCSLPWQQPSCSPAYMEVQTTPVFCKTSDVKLVVGVKPADFFVQYFDGAGATSVNEPASNSSTSTPDRATALQSATTVSVAIHAEQTAGGRDIERSAVLRATRLDDNASVATNDGAPSEPTVPLWTPFSMQNGWVNYYNTYTSGAYTKTSAGVIILKGMVKSGSGVITTLPDGYRPAQRLIISTRTSSINDGRLDIYPTGQLNVETGDNSWFSLDGIAFMPSGTSLTDINSFSNGWTNYSSSGGTFPAASYSVDSNGRVHLAGLVKGGTNTFGTTMLTLPTPARPPEAIIIANVNGSTAVGEFRLDADGSLLARGYSNSYASLQTMYYTGTRVSGSNCSTQWCAMSLQNSWTNYPGGYPDALYTKSSDGLVMLKGLIRDGSSSTAQIATLPVGFCPAERHLLTVATTGGAGSARLDVRRDDDGSCAILPMTGTNTGWVSLSAIRYMAEP